MRKVLVVLLVLAVVGGVSALDGSWWLGSEVEVGTSVNLKDKPVVIGGQAFNYYWWDSLYGAVNLGYNVSGFEAFIGFKTSDNLLLAGKYDGGNYAFQAESYFDNIVGGWKGANRLWGYYKFLGGMVHLEAAMKSRDTNYWISSEAVGEVFAGKDGWDTQYADIGWGFASVDGHNYLATNFAFAGLDVGFMLPNIFFTEYGNKVKGNGEGVVGNRGPNWHESQIQDWGPHGAVEFVEGALKQLVAGAKFQMSPIEFALQFNMANYGAYLGTKLGLGPITFGLSFEGTFESNNTTAGGAISADYNAGIFGAKLGAGYLYFQGANANIIGVTPSFWYNVLPNNLAFSLDSGFWFAKDYFNWAFMPTLWWNFKGTGAGANFWWPNQTAIIMRYRMQKDAINALDVTFKWNF